MRTFRLLNLVLAGLMAVSLTTVAVAQQAHVEQTISSLSATKAVPVTWKNFVRAESDKMFNSYVQMGAFGKFFNIPKPTPIDQQKVVRMNRDTIYSLKCERRTARTLTGCWTTLGVVNRIRVDNLIRCPVLAPKNRWREGCQYQSAKD